MSTILVIERSLTENYIGAIGTIFCEFSLEAGHNLTLFVRNRDKVPAKVSNNDRVAIIEGTLENEGILDEVSKCGADSFVSFAGPPMGNQGTVWKYPLKQNIDRKY